MIEEQIKHNDKEPFFWVVKDNFTKSHYLSVKLEDKRQKIKISESDYSITKDGKLVIKDYIKNLLLKKL